MKELPAKIIHQATFDACEAYVKFFKKLSKYPKYKSKKETYQSFWNPPDAIKFSKRKVMLQKIGWVELLERDRIPQNAKYYNPIISFDGINFWISIGIEVCDNQENNMPISEPIGIDLGIKTLATCSNGIINNKPNTKRLEKKLKRLQRKASRLYIKYRGKDKSKNLLKLEKDILSLYQKKVNILNDNIHKFTTSLIKLNPEYIAIEDLNVSGMMKNRHLSRSIADCKFYEIRRQLEYKCKWNNIELILVDRWFPSSKMCNICGQIKSDLKLSDRVYKCDCGNSEDRDVNASKNIRDFSK
jgi:putative transposase